MMFQQLRPAHIHVPGAIGDCAADLRRRQRLIVAVLPRHRQRRQAPAVPAGDAGSVQVCSLMTLRAVRAACGLAGRSLVAGGASQAGHAAAFLPTYHIELVPMSVVALLRIVGCGVAIEAAWIGQYGIDLLPSGKGFGAGWMILRCGALT